MGKSSTYEEAVPSPSGPYTYELAKLLGDLCRDTRYKVYHDPHKSNNDKIPDVIRCHPTPVMSKSGHGQALSHVDVVILDKSINRAVLLIEVEEGGSANDEADGEPEKDKQDLGGVSPKTIIGDIVNIALSEAMNLKSKPYDYESIPELFLGIVTKAQGRSKQKATAVVDRLTAIVGDRVHVTCFTDPSVKDLIHKITQAVAEKLSLA